MTIDKRPYGNSGLYVSALGLGAGQIGDAKLSEAAINKLLNDALDYGVTLIDTAPGYGLSEARIGRYLRSRRADFVLSTKLGYGVSGVEDWTGACITAGVEQALRVMHTDRLDIAHLHSCPQHVLAETDVIDALERAKREGKIRAIAYSGENDDLVYAVSTGRFDGFMASLNICDQRVLIDVLPYIGGKGFIAKRPSANHPWRFPTLPVGDYCEEYWRRWHAMSVSAHGLERGEFAIRFALSMPMVSSAIIGTANPAHLIENIRWAGHGKLPPAWVEDVCDAFKRHDRGWTGQI